MADPIDALALVAFNAAIFGALITPGPAFLIILRSSMIDGRGMALRTGFGLACAAIVWSSCALAGLTALFALVPAAWMVMKIAGAAYLLWFARSLWLNANNPVDDVRKVRRLRGFTLGFTANLANPKLVFFIAAIFSTVFPQEPVTSVKFLILANHFALEVMFYSFVACVMTTSRVRTAYLRVKAPLERFAALLLGALAFRIAAT